MSASSVMDSTSSGSDSDLESPALPASAQQPSSALHRDSLPPRFTSRQISASGSRSAGNGISPNFPHEQPSTSPNPPNLFTPSMTPEARRQSMIAMDRKRRLTGSVSTYEPARRRYIPTEFLTRTRSNEQDPQPSQYTQRPVHQDHASENTSNSPHREVIDLTGSSPPLPPPHSPPRHNQPSRTSSSSSRRYAVPEWQPDAGVSHCPICKKQFTWMFRRHHCRKCGRVVCDSCSPHRITIPRQFIVNPPRPESSSVTAPRENETIDLTVEDEGEEVTRTRRRSRHASIHTVEGGEKVRLCNPCVPDPQPEPPPYFTPFLQDLNPQVLQSGLQGPAAAPSHTNIFGQPRRGANFPFAHAPRDLISPGRVDFSTSLGSRPRPSSITNPYSMYFPEPGHRRNAGSPPQGSSLFPGGRPNNVSISHSSVGRLLDLAAQNPLPRLPDSGQFHPSTYGHGRYSSMDTQSRSQPSVPSRPRGSSMFDLEPRHGTMFPPSSRALLPSSSRPRLHERDICPICRRALPPRGENHDETAREGHIMACITARDPSSGAGAEAGSSSRGPIHMVAFTASEKDCVGEEGNVQECSICMVEYDVGDELARLECFCKFHKECIVSWLNRKAECPVHKAARFNV